MKIDINSKEDAGRNLADITSRIRDQASEIVKIPGIVAASCIMDANHTLLIQSLQDAFLDGILLATPSAVQTQTKNRTQIRLELKAALSRFFFNWHERMENALVHVWRNGRESRTVQKSVDVCSFICAGHPTFDQFVQIAVQRDMPDPEQGIYYLRKVFLAALFPVTYALIFRGLEGTEHEPIIERLLRLQELLTAHQVLETALWANLRFSMELSEKGASFELKSDPIEVLNKLWLAPSTSPRYVDYAIGPDDWDQTVKALGLQGREAVWQGEKKGSQNLAYFSKEFHAVYGAYAKLPGFPNAFQTYFGCSLRTFYRIVEALFVTAYPCTRSVAVLPAQRLEVLVAKKAGLSRSQVRSMIRRLTYTGQVASRGCPIFVVPPVAVVPHLRVAEAFLEHTQRCLEEKYNPALKGPVFEEQCRELLRRAGLVVAPSSIAITEPYLPSYVSLQLWNEIKNGTDLDVLASEDGLLLLLEAKQRQLSETQARRIVKMRNRMNRFQVDLWWKAFWLSQEWEHFCAAYLNDDLKQAFSDVKFLMPMVVSTYAYDIVEQAPPVITTKELPNILREIAQRKWTSAVPNQETQLVIEGLRLEFFFFPLRRTKPAAHP